MKLRYLILILVALGVLFFFFQREKTVLGNQIFVGENMFEVSFADTEAERVRGLSLSKELLEGEGMLFIFPNEDYWGIWMKDMNYSIDIIWFDKNKKVIHIEESIGPETYPRVFQPVSKSMYVLEVPAKTTKMKEIKMGDQLTY